METLEHRATTVDRMLRDHWANYGGYKPSEDERAAHIEWARKQDEDTLQYALRFDNHHKTSSGSPIKPILHVLRGIAYDYRKSRGDFRKEPLPDTRPMEPQCLYCSYGDVYDLEWIEGKGWRQAKKGKCKHCSGGDCEPRKEIMFISEKTGVFCVEVIFWILLSCFRTKVKNLKIVGENELIGGLRRHYPEMPTKTVQSGPGNGPRAA